jgi:uncharacterized protein
MSLELRQVPPVAGRPVLKRYGAEGFRVSGQLFPGAVLLLPDGARDWPVEGLSEVTVESLEPVTARDDVEILLLGTGARMLGVPASLRQELRRRGIGLEPMDTGAACRTYGVLVSEDRRVAAALLKV